MPSEDTITKTRAGDGADLETLAVADEVPKISLSVAELKIVQRLTGTKISVLFKEMAEEEFSVEVIEAFAAIQARRENPELTWDQAIESVQDLDAEEALGAMNTFTDPT
jgi:hypothetical protein